MQTGLAASFSVLLTLALIFVFYLLLALVVDFTPILRYPGKSETTPLEHLVFWILLNYIPHLAAYSSSFALTKRVFPRSDRSVVFGALSVLLLLNAGLVFFLFMVPGPLVTLLIVMGLGSLTIFVLLTMLTVQMPSKTEHDP